jgi:hypothetical protein
VPFRVLNPQRRIEIIFVQCVPHHKKGKAFHWRLNLIS